MTPAAERRRWLAIRLRRHHPYLGPWRQPILRGETAEGSTKKSDTEAWQLLGVTQLPHFWQVPLMV